MKIAVVTNCSARKALPPDARLTARTLSTGSAKNVAFEWSRRLRGASQWLPASRLYQGRGICEAKLAAESTESPLHIISGGLAFIRDSDLIPPYSLTVSSDQPDSIQAKIEQTKLKDWWKAMNAVGIGKRQLSEWISGLRDTLIVFALTPNYLSLVSDELNSLPTKDLERVRFTGPRARSVLPESFKELTMPYDGRLNGSDSPIRGTESDFPQRAARHFISLIRDRPRLAAADRHSRLVRKTIEGWRYGTKEVRRRLPETQLRKVVADLAASGDRWTIALRILRNDMDIACEQGRFQALWQEMKDIDQ